MAIFVKAPYFKKLRENWTIYSRQTPNVKWRNVKIDSDILKDKYEDIECDVNINIEQDICEYDCDSIKNMPVSVYFEFTRFDLKEIHLDTVEKIWIELEDIGEFELNNINGIFSTTVKISNTLYEKWNGKFNFTFKIERKYYLKLDK